MVLSEFACFRRLGGWLPDSIGIETQSQLDWPTLKNCTHTFKHLSDFFHFPCFFPAGKNAASSAGETQESSLFPPH
jgi:hypothetical protein